MIQFIVHGVPAPQGSKRHVGRGILVESSKKVAPWREAVKWGAIKAMAGRPAMDGPIYASISFWFTPPKSAKKGAQPTTRGTGDLDKLLRSTFDAITDAGMIRDDSQIVRVMASKAYITDGAPPYALIGIKVDEQS